MDTATELVARFHRECAGAEHIGPDRVGMFLPLLTEAKVDGVELGERQLRVTLTAEEKDRHGDIVRSSGAALKNFRKNPVVLFGHRHDLPAIGKVVKGSLVKEEGRLTAIVEFAPTALGEELYLLYKGGYMKGWSIGFIPLKWALIDSEDTTVHEGPAPFFDPIDIKKWELLELSAVPVPANASALTNALKTSTDVDEITREVQAWHKAAVDRAAVEAPEDADEDPADVEEREHGELAPDEYGDAMGGVPTLPNIIGPELDATTIQSAWDEALIEVRGKTLSGLGELALFDYTPEDHQALKEANNEIIRDLIEENDLDPEEGIDLALLAETGYSLEYADGEVEFRDATGTGAVDGPDGEVDQLTKVSDDNYTTIGYRKYPKADEDEAWDEGAARREMEVEDLKKYATVYLKEDPDVKGSYKLLHHEDGGNTNLRGAQAAIGVLNGARGGMKPAPSQAVKQVAYNHLAKHVREFDREPAELKDYVDTTRGPVLVTFAQGAVSADGAARFKEYLAEAIANGDPVIDVPEWAEFKAWPVEGGGEISIETEGAMEGLLNLTQAVEELADETLETIEILERLTEVRAKATGQEPVEPDADANANEDADPDDPAEGDDPAQGEVTKEQMNEAIAAALGGSLKQEVAKAVKLAFDIEAGRSVQDDQ